MLTTLTVAELMTTPLISVHPEEETHDAIHLLIEHQLKRFPVLDGNGQVTRSPGSAYIALWPIGSDRSRGVTVKINPPGDKS